MNNNLYNKKFGIIFLARDVKFNKDGVRSFRIYFRSLAEQKYFNLNFPKKYYYPQTLLVDNLKRKRGYIKRYQSFPDPSLDLHKLYSESNYIIEFDQNDKFDRLSFWKEFEDWCIRFNYRVLYFDRHNRTTGDCFVEIKTINDFYG